jgi:hypothetical protein
MPSDDELKAMYGRMCRHDITVRRFTGVGASRTKTDYTVKGIARLYGGKELAGSITQGDQKVIVLAADLTALGFVLPVTNADRLIVGGKEVSIIAAPDRTGLDGAAIAYECQARG